MGEKLKVCTGCRIAKDLACFSKCARGAGGLQAKCKECNASYYRNHSDRVKARVRAWTKANRREVTASQCRYANERYRSDPNFKLAVVLRRRLAHALKGGFRSGSAVRDLGCAVEELKKYLESKFQPGMTWENWSSTGWHIDHIRPLASFDLTDRAQFLQACHYTNLQPLWAAENIRKSDG